MLRVSRAAKGFSNVRGYASAASPPKRRVGAVRGGYTDRQMAKMLQANAVFLHLAY